MNPFKNTLFLSLIFLTSSLTTLFSQENNSEAIKNHQQEIENFRNQKDIDYKNPSKTMLTPELMKDFVGLKYYPIDYNFKVEATLKKYDEMSKIEIKTSTGDILDYVIYGKLSFTINGKPYYLSVYQYGRSVGSSNKKNALFLPFTDDTSGDETYGGGRYLVLDIPDSNTITLDFNRAYNPYCVYNPNHSCPIPPKENHLPVKITVGELMY